MKLSLKALRGYVDFEGGAKDVAAVFSELGFPHDGIHHVGAGCESVLIAKIKDKKPHPDADRLSLLTLDAGAHSSDLPIVCGAQNMKAGDLVALAPVGASIPGKDGEGFQLRKAKIRGHVSEGMCCSEAELGLSDESDGIWLLPAELEAHLGEPVLQHVNVQDSVIELDVTPNRGDALSVKGLAREYAAKKNLKLKTQKTARWKHPSAAAKPSIASFSEASGFAACLVKNVKVQESPESWKFFLHQMGSRSISNLVDVSNVVLFELGHPIHIFDADKVEPQSIELRFAKAGEKLLLLDDREIKLHSEDLVIADKSGVLSLAGVMGGKASSVSGSTKNILIEVASFNPLRIRASAARHQIHSEASFRFERGVTAFHLEDVIERALGLLQESGGFDSAEGSICLSPKHDRPSCLWSREKVERKLGRLKQSDDEIFALLRRLDYEFEPGGGNPKIFFPWYRTDSAVLEDVMEDVARLVGYESLEEKILTAEESVAVEDALKPKLSVGYELLSRFCDRGFTEVLHSSFSDPSEFKKIDSEFSDFVDLANPIHSEKSIMRPSLLPGLFERAKFNMDRFEENISLVEMGPVFSKNMKSIYADSPVGERWMLSCVWIPRAIDRKKMWASSVDQYYEFKGRLESIFEGFKPGSLSSQNSWLENIFQVRRIIHFSNGFAGEMHPRVLKALDLNSRVFVGEWELNFDKAPLSYKRPGQFPAIDLDLSLEMASSLAVGDLQEAIKKEAGALLDWARPYDVYESDELKKKSRKAVTFALRYVSSEKTLEMTEIEKQRDLLIKALSKRFVDASITLR